MKKLFLVIAIEMSFKEIKMLGWLANSQNAMQINFYKKKPNIFLSPQYFKVSLVNIKL